MDEFTPNRYRVMRSLLTESELKGKVLLDLGTGSGSICQGLRCKRLITTDIRRECYPCVVCDLGECMPLAERSVDVVVAGEILEHIAHSRQFLQEVRRVLVENGVFVLSTPNIVSLKYRLAFVLGRIPAHAAKGDYTYASGDPANARGHVRDYTFSEVRRVLVDAGFLIVQERGTGLCWRGRRLIPSWALPPTLGDQVVVKAVARER